MKRTAIVVGLVLLAGAVAALGFFWPFGGGAGTLTLYGTVEIQEVRLGSKVGGRVEKIAVREGEMVEANQPLVWFEVPELQKQRDQMAAKLLAARTELDKTERSLPHELKSAKAAAEAAQAEYERTRKSAKPDIAIARHDLQTAEAELQFAKLEFKRMSALLEQNQAVSQSEYDKARTAKDQGEAKRDAAKAKLNKLQATEKDTVEAAKSKWQQAQADYQKLDATQYQIQQAAQAQVDEAKANLAGVEVNLKEAVVRAPEKAIVEVVAVRKGDLVTANQPVVRILRADDMWVKVYVPETKLGKLRLKQSVDVYVDAYPDHAFKGTIFQIGSTSEYTPRNVQSVEERRYQVFPVKVRIENPQGVFRAGMAARVAIRLQSAREMTKE